MHATGLHMHMRTLCHAVDLHLGNELLARLLSLGQHRHAAAALQLHRRVGPGRLHHGEHVG